MFQKRAFLFLLITLACVTMTLSIRIKGFREKNWKSTVNDTSDPRYGIGRYSRRWRPDFNESGDPFAHWSTPAPWDIVPSPSPPPLENEWPEPVYVRRPGQPPLAASRIKSHYNFSDVYKEEKLVEINDLHHTEDYSYGKFRYKYKM